VCLPDKLVLLYQLCGIILGRVCLQGLLLVLLQLLHPHPKPYCYCNPTATIRYLYPLPNSLTRSSANNLHLMRGSLLVAWRHPAVCDLKCPVLVAAVLCCVHI
jgi:hypothetical protein